MDNGLRTLIEPVSFVSADRAHLSEMPGPFQKHRSGGEMNVEVWGAGFTHRAPATSQHGGNQPASPVPGEYVPALQARSSR
jgi:hypothetical protein